MRAPAYLRTTQRSADRGRRLRLEYEGVTRAQRNWQEMKGKRQLWRAANQCLGGETLIPSPYGPPRRIDSMSGREWVWAWDGAGLVAAEAFVNPARGPDPLYTITLSTGRTIRATGNHRLAGPVGDWRFVGDLVPGDRLLADEVVSVAEGPPEIHYDVEVPDWGNVVTDDGNVNHNCGKSRGSAKKILHFIRATGPFADRTPGPKKVLIMSFSKEQMEPLMEKLWELLPKDEVSEDVEFQPGFGFRGKPPRIVFTSGPGAGSVIIFATYKQGSRRAAGGTFDVVVLDEPVEERIWGEIQPRVLHGDPGEIWITFTPTPDSPPLDYLRKMVDAGKVVEMTTELSVASVTLEDGRALLTQEQIDDYASGLLDLEKDMRLRGGWDIVSTDRVLDMWGPHCLQWGDGPPPGALLAVGVDHGAGQGKQAAALIAVIDHHTTSPRVWLWAESVSEGFTTNDMDAEAVLAMLKSCGLTYDDIDVWVGDRASGMNKFDVRKTNRDLRNQMANILKRHPDKMKWIETPHKFGGSVGAGFRVVNSIMGRRDSLHNEGDKEGPSHFLVHPSCVHFAKAAQKWKGNPKDREKDILDGGRYAVERVCSHGIVASFAARYA